MAQKLKIGELSSLETLYSYQWKAIQVNKNQNCIVQFIEDAEEEARKCDEIPLKGTLKEVFRRIKMFS